MQKTSKFERIWLLDPTTSGQPIIFPPHLQEIGVMAKWVCEKLFEAIKLLGLCLLMRFFHYFQSPHYIDL